MADEEEGPSSSKRPCLNLNVEDDDDDFDFDDLWVDIPDSENAIQEDASSKDLDPLHGKSFAYRIVLVDEVYNQMTRIVTEAHEVIENVPASTLRTMLNHVNWDLQRLLSRYYENEEKFLEEANVQFGSTVIPRTQNNTCLICFEPLAETSSMSLSCGHRSCNSCWIQYLTHKIMEEGLGQTITCPECSIIVEDLDVKKLVTDEKVLSKYKTHLCNNFVGSNKRMRWCGKAGCTNVVSAEVATCGRVQCPCGHDLCFGCGLEWHEPILCVDLRNWLDKVAKDTGCSTWMIKNTKDCPSCQTMIEKNGGCNHMTCKKCGQHFCWNCGQKWETHTGQDGYHCNRLYDPKETTATTSSRRLNVQRFSHFHSRWANHARSLTLESSLEATLRVKAVQYQQEHGMDWTQVLFLHEAFNVLVRCRKTLMTTYAFAYYLDATPMSIIFDSNQSDLERETETLSHYLENDLATDKFTPQQHRSRISDKSNYCEQRRLVLVQHVYEGYDAETWKFITAT